MPQMNFCNSYQMNRIIDGLKMVEGNTIEIYAITDSDGSLSKYFISIRNKETVKIIVEINEIQTLKTIDEIKETKS